MWMKCFLLSSGIIQLIVIDIFCYTSVGTYKYQRGIIMKKIIALLVFVLMISVFEGELNAVVNKQYDFMDQHSKLDTTIVGCEGYVVLKKITFVPYVHTGLSAEVTEGTMKYEFYNAKSWFFSNSSGIVKVSEPKPEEYVTEWGFPLRDTHYLKLTCVQGPCIGSVTLRALDS